MKTAVSSINTVKEYNASHYICRRFLAKVDKVVDSMNTSVNTNESLHALWEGYVHCINGSYIDGCRGEGRAVWKKALQVLSLIFESFAVDMTTYLTEVNG